jgi:2,4-diketo-3-deoxy-L-fuconate hydrolase
MAIPFALGTFSVAGCPPFAGVIIEDRVTAVTALQPLCEKLAGPLNTPETVFGLLQAWDRCNGYLDHPFLKNDTKQENS